MQINRLMFAMLATLAAILLAPTNASAYAVTGDPTVLYVGESDQFVRFTVTGAASNITAFTVGVTPDSMFPSYLDGNVSLTNLANTTGAAVDPLFDADSSVSPPVFAALSSQTIVDPFDIVQGDIFVISFTALSPTKAGTSFIDFEICGLTADGNQCSQMTPVRVDIVERGGNKVPEPATLWLAVAALVAGGLIIRKDSKSS